MFCSPRRYATARITLHCTVLTLLMVLCGSVAQASLIGAGSNPKQARVLVEEGRTIQVRWIVSTTPAHHTGAFSPQGVLKDAATSTVLKTQVTPFNDSEGAGPLHFEEALIITAEEARKWLELGYRKLQYTRQFSTGSEKPSTSEASVSILLATKDMGLNAATLNVPLAIHNLELSFKPQRFRSQITQGLPLQAQLGIIYSGQGQLQGSWQLGTIDPSSGQLVYQELAQVNKDLQQGRKDWLLSPQLDTVKTGHHVLRFCALESLETVQATPTNLCPNQQLSSTLEYQVIADSQQASAIQAPASLSASTQLTWPATADTVVYELVLRQENGKESVTSGEYVGRLLIPAPRTGTVLSGALLEQLKPGATYLWQVNALDLHGDLIRQTAPARFVFMP
ncbi:MAG: hypothetical protein VYA55_04630 [Pseudomonadota bacterium]|nr:hypothetical protein [Pseudomonadota bacterium]